MTNEQKQYDIPLNGVQLRHLEREIRLRLEIADERDLYDERMQELGKLVELTREAGRDGHYFRVHMTPREFHLALYIIEARYQRLRRTHGEDTQRSGYALATAQAESALEQFRLRNRLTMEQRRRYSW